MKLGHGIAKDLRARTPWYVSDWKEGFNSGYRIFAPSVYIFFASVIPALAFGEQIERDTGGAFNGVHVLVSTALAGIVQAIVGGQPLLILGVAEPIVLMYSFMWEFAEGRGFSGNFVPWCTCTTFFASVLIVAFAVTGTCEYISKFTRFSGELFGMLIALLFIQQAIKGVVDEFRVTRCVEAETAGPVAGASVAEGCVEYTPAERLVNGLWAVVLSMGTLGTCLLMITARRWGLFKAGIRSFLADYGVPLMVVVWSGVSYALEAPTPPGIPRRLSLPDAWDPAGRANWDAVSRLGDLSSAQVAYSIVPAVIITLLFYFDHNVSSQLGQQPDFQLVRPTSYSWDFTVLAGLMALAGLLGIPPPNCVIPQAAMHTKSLITLKQMLVDRTNRKKASQANLTGLGFEGGAAAHERAAPLHSGPAPPVHGGSGVGGAGGGTPARDADESGDLQSEKEWLRLNNGVVPLKVKEQRLSNLIQALLVAASIGAMPVVRRIPRSVLWGYFAFMALESLPGNEFWDRLVLLFTDTRKRVNMLKGEHPAYLETVAFRTIAKFTVLQTVYMLAVWAITFAGAAGIAFPFLIILLIPGRQYVMPRLFDAWSLSQLDAAEYEEAPPAPEWVVREAAEREGASATQHDEYEAREVLDAEMPGRRGAILHHLSANEMRRRTSIARASREGAPVDTAGASTELASAERSSAEPHLSRLSASVPRHKQQGRAEDDAV